MVVEPHKRAPMQVQVRVLVVVAHRKCFGATSHAIAAVATGVVLHLTSDFHGTSTWIRPSDVYAHT